MAAARTVGLALLMAVAVLGLPAMGLAPAASACSCAVGTTTLSEPRRADEVLFEGRVLGGRDLGPSETVWTVETTRVLRGDVTSVQPVVADPSGASCGLQFTVGQPYLIGARADGRPGVLGTGLCTVTTAVATMTPEERDTLARFYGPGRPPRDAPPAPVPERPREPGPGTALGAITVGLAGIAGIAGVGFLVRRRRRG